MRLTFDLHMYAHMCLHSGSHMSPWFLLLRTGTGAQSRADSQPATGLAVQTIRLKSVQCRVVPWEWGSPTSLYLQALTRGPLRS